MRLALIDDHEPAVVNDRGIVPLGPALPEVMALPGPRRMIALIEAFDDARSTLDEAAAAAPVRSDAALRAPLPRPGKILCARGNYREYSDREPWPLDVFLKSPTAVIGPNDTVVLPPREHRVFHHEAELAVVIGTTGHGFGPEEALDHVFGFTAFIDVSGRGNIGRRDGASFLGKSYDTFAPLGPVIVTRDEIDDPQTLSVKLWVSGDLRQDYNTDDMEHPIPELLAFASSVMTLEPGDVLACGTNHQQLGPIQDGDEVRIEIERIGGFSVAVADPSKRVWAREFDSEMAARTRRNDGTPAPG